VFIPGREDVPIKSVSRVDDVILTNVGWIPLLFSRRKWPQYAKDVEPGPLRLLMHFLFRSGNECLVDELSNPDPDVMDDETLLGLEASRNFRALLAVTNVNVFRDDLGIPTSAEFDVFAKVGFTPIRVLGARKPLFY